MDVQEEVKILLCMIMRGCGFTLARRQRVGNKAEPICALHDAASREHRAIEARSQEITSERRTAEIVAQAVELVGMVAIIIAVAEIGADNHYDPAAHGVAAHDELAGHLVEAFLATPVFRQLRHRSPGRV